MKREEGYYWCMDYQGNWSIWKWINEEVGGGWYLVDNDAYYKDDTLHKEIDENRIVNPNDLK